MTAQEIAARARLEVDDHVDAQSWLDAIEALSDMIDSLQREVDELREQIGKA